MKTFYRILSVLIFFSILGLLVFIPGRKWARTHVNSKTGVTDHPLLCISCHLYTQRDGLAAKLINTKYLSPFNLAVSKDGNRLYVVAQESNEVLVVDAVKQKVLTKIMVGTQPHSIVLSNDGQKAYVSNQWYFI